MSTSVITWEKSLSMRPRDWEAEHNGYSLHVRGAARGSGEKATWRVGYRGLLLRAGDAWNTMRAKRKAETYVLSGKAEKRYEQEKLS